MKQEILKKIVELADGFTYTEEGTFPYLFFRDSNGLQIMHDTRIEQWDCYPLLLRRAVEGCYHLIIFDNKKYLTCLSLEDDKQTIEYSNYTKNDYLTPCEQAIEACLIELLEK